MRPPPLASSRLAHRAIVALCGAMLCATSLRPVRGGDEFDSYTSSVLDQVPNAAGVTAVERLPLHDLLKTRSVLKTESGGFVVVRTDEGHWAKLILGQSYRKQAGGEDVPLLLIQRFQCLRPGTERGRLAAGKDIYLFDGFQFNLDIGQIVPEGAGGDLIFRRDARGGVVEPVGKAKLYFVKEPLVVSRAERAGPSTGPVVAEDYIGNYRLIANGKWSGRLVLEVRTSGEVVGSYVSDQTGSDYPVKGFVARPAHHIKFTVELPVAKQEFDGYLWTQGKNAIAGTMILAGNTFGFVAVREGSELVAKESD